MAKLLAKIESIQLGVEDGRFGLWVSFKGPGWGVCDSSLWYWTGERSDHAKWTEADRSEMKVRILDRIENLCSDAGVRNLADLKGKPVECDFGGGPNEPTFGRSLESWRILTEVI